MDRLLDITRKEKSSYIYAKETATLLRDLFLHKKYGSLNDYYRIIKDIAKLLKTNKPLEFSIENTIKRVLTLIREQASQYNIELIDMKRLETKDQYNLEFSTQRKISQVKSYHNLTTSRMEESENINKKIDSGDGFNEKEDDTIMLSQIRTNLIDQLEDLIMEFDLLSSEINKFASSHIYANEIIMTFGYSTTIISFLSESHQSREFSVIVVEDGATKRGEQMVKTLIQNKINSVLIQDTAVYAVMARVNKIFISPHAVMANGGTISNSGSLLLAAAAKAHSVPFIVLAGLFKLTPQYPFEQDTFNDIQNPGPFFERQLADHFGNINVIIPRFDYIDPNYISLYITNFGEHTPSYIYRLFTEYYSREEFKS